MKILVVGDAKCGKTSLIQRFANVRHTRCLSACADCRLQDVFAEEYKTTIGADFSRKTVELDSDNTVRCHTL